MCYLLTWIKCVHKNLSPMPTRYISMLIKIILANLISISLLVLFVLSPPSPSYTFSHLSVLSHLSSQSSCNPEPTEEEERKEQKEKNEMKTSYLSSRLPSIQWTLKPQNFLEQFISSTFMNLCLCLSLKVVIACLMFWVA